MFSVVLHEQCINSREQVVALQKWQNRLYMFGRQHVMLIEPSGILRAISKDFYVVKYIRF